MKVFVLFDLILSVVLAIAAAILIGVPMLIVFPFLFAFVVARALWNCVRFVSGKVLLARARQLA